MAIPIPTRIYNMFNSMARGYSAGCEITYGKGNDITHEEPANDDGDGIDSDYDPSENASNTSDPPPDTPNNINPDDDFIAKLDDDYAAIILNTAVFDHNGPIVGVGKTAIIYTKSSQKCNQQKLKRIQIPQNKKTQKRTISKSNNNHCEKGISS